jgi:hypothetical protein
MIQRNLEVAAARREQGDLGGTLTLATGETIPCSLGVDTSGLQRADNSAGFQFNQTRRVIVRTALLADIPRAPQAGDTVTVQGNLEDGPVSLVISPSNGIEQMNGILTAFNLYNPNI